MAALNFPASPTNGQTYTANGKTFVWNGSVWVAQVSAINAISQGNSAVTVTDTGANGKVAIATEGNDVATVSSDGQLSTVVPGSTTLYPGFVCRAWVNFNGTGDVSIRASGNVSSITDDGVGLFTVNFATSMPDTNYAAVIYNNAYIAINDVGDFDNNLAGGVFNQSTSAVKVASYSVTFVDSALYNVVVFR